MLLPKDNRAVFMLNIHASQSQRLWPSNWPQMQSAFWLLEADSAYRNTAKCSASETELLGCRHIGINVRYSQSHCKYNTVYRNQVQFSSRKVEFYTKHQNRTWCALCITNNHICDRLMPSSYQSRLLATSGCLQNNPITLWYYAAHNASISSGPEAVCGYYRVEIRCSSELMPGVGDALPYAKTSNFTGGFCTWRQMMNDNGTGEQQNINAGIFPLVMFLLYKIRDKTR